MEIAAGWFSLTCLFAAVALLADEDLFVAAKMKKALFVFGDSLFDAGNNQYLNRSSRSSSELEASTWPYGETYFKRPTGRLSDGRIVPDFVAQFARLPILLPYLQPGAKDLRNGANFASAGAGVLSETHHGMISLGEQLSYFREAENTLKQQMGAAATGRLLTDAVYLFSMGGNDYFHFYLSNSKAATQPKKRGFVARVIGNLSQVLQEVYDMGGRKIGFQNAGPLGCAPGMKAMNGFTGPGCIALLSELARLHNRALSRVLAALAAKNPGFKYSIFNYYDALYDRITNPSKYGFKDGADACCGPIDCGRNGTAVCSNPSEYVWFDGGHTTQRANYQLAQLIWAGPMNITRPYNLRQFFL
uniref:Uncharacterized protein n=1 Tax=Kalanchoe fedtschenkoi TaxID=63787 RepID=A0A7N0ZXC3_KALFE